MQNKLTKKFHCLGKSDAIYLLLLDDTYHQQDNAFAHSFHTLYYQLIAEKVYKSYI